MKSITELEKRAQCLEKENQRLKRLLADAGISYSIEDTDDSGSEYDPDQGSRILPRNIMETDAKVFFSMFWGRTDVYSRRTGGKKICDMIHLLRERQEAGVKISIVTWDPDSYGYGDSAYWQELQEQMRRAGFEMNLVEDYCEHYCIIDHEVVWYGSMNFLGKEDAEDNLMRIADAKIADKLLEITFGNDKYQGETM